MTDKKPAAAKPAGPAPAPAGRRISQPRPKKAPAKPAPTSPTAATPAPPASSHDADLPPAAPDAGQQARPTSARGAGILPAAIPPSPATPDLSPVAATPAGPEASSPSSGAWPEPDAPSSGGHATAEGKRKRRRRKGKGQPAHANAIAAATEEIPSGDEAAETTAAVTSVTPAAPRPPPQVPQPPPRQHAAPRAKMDPEMLSNKAWKIFLAEVSEEGIALIGDSDARELARRCFRLAEIFLEEQSRRLPGA